MNHITFQQIYIVVVSCMLIGTGLLPIIQGNDCLSNQSDLFKYTQIEDNHGKKSSSSPYHYWELLTEESVIMNTIIVGNLVIEDIITDHDCWDDQNYHDYCEMFAHCVLPKDFFDVVQNSTIDAWAQTRTQSLHLIDTNLTSLISTANTENNSLCCAQQTLLVLYGVIAVFSCYDTNLNQIYLEPSHKDFKMEIWRSFDFCFPVFPWRSHYQLIVDVWDGNDFFTIHNETVDKLEIDPWENEFRAWDVSNECFGCPFLLPKLNTIIYTAYQSPFFNIHS